MTDQRTFYHYCSLPAFQSIMEQKRLRLSLLSMSNDAKEGQHIIDVVNRILPGSFAHKEKALEDLKIVISMLSAIGFCVSTDGDELSQWRGYADNAQGVSIGFDREALREATSKESNRGIFLFLNNVIYEDRVLTDLIEPLLKPVVEHYHSGKMARPRLGMIAAPLTEDEKKKDQQRYELAVGESFELHMKIANYAYLVKAPFFKDEKEWRILGHVTNLDRGLDFPDVQFTASQEKLKPFRNFPLAGFSPSMVTEVVMGPRNQTPTEVMRLFLDSTGFEHVELDRSIGSYR